MPEWLEFKIHLCVYVFEEGAHWHNSHGNYGDMRLNLNNRL